MSSSSDFSSLHTSIVQPVTSGPHLPMQRSCPLHITCLSNACFRLSPKPPAFSFPPDSLGVLQQNARDLRARNTELLHFISSHPMDFIGIQKSNLNSSSSFRMLGYSALRSDRTHSWSGILSLNDPHASGGVIIFIKQGLFFSDFLPPLSLPLTPTLTM